MRASVPSNWVSHPVRFLQPSASGGDPHPVVADGGDTACGCKGFRYGGRCRHAKPVIDWLEAVIPPGELPE